MPPKKAAATKAAPKPPAKKGTSPAEKSSKAEAHTSSTVKHDATGMFDMPKQRNRGTVIMEKTVPNSPTSLA